MDWTEIVDPGRVAGGRSLSSASTASGTLIPTPASSETGGVNPSPARAPMPAVAPAGPLLVTTLSPTSWRPQYPRIGQFAVTPSREVVAAGPNGLISFTQILDHPSRPWSEPRPFPPTTARLDASTVTGLTVHREQGTGGILHVCCVADGVLHAFSRSEDPGSSFVVDPSPPFAGSRVSGTPAVARIETRYDDRNWCIVAPCQSGGMLFTLTDSSQGGFSYGPPKQGWEPASQVAGQIGIVSAVSVAVTRNGKRRIFGGYSDSTFRSIVAVCIASGRLHSVEGPLERPSMYRKSSWQDPKATRVQHLGEVTGNPVLLRNYKDGMDGNVDLLVPSAEGGVFHFVRTPTSPDEWHMIGRIKFPRGVPIASSLACARLNSNYGQPIICAYVQCGGRLYLIKTPEGPCPWVGCQLYPIEGPGPFLH
ncbi:hypothetical protein INS49_007077 [Diaporthe citri]|uniref:uncharacterized protein n=1 Tax=Diaporthe citri TaxID=83186 RepID=UPI001C80C387|nr:uncharacterized protein INS49_007077 [Diaporthe citri]KAG6365466.1 hypothetical protein INS49_007077 [Diaporthe citri]